MQPSWKPESRDGAGTGASSALPAIPAGHGSQAADSHDLSVVPLPVLPVQDAAQSSQTTSGAPLSYGKSETISVHAALLEPEQLLQRQKIAVEKSMNGGQRLGYRAVQYAGRLAQAVCELGYWVGAFKGISEMLAHHPWRGAAYVAGGIAASVAGVVAKAVIELLHDYIEVDVDQIRINGGEIRQAAEASAAGG